MDGQNSIEDRLHRARVESFDIYTIEDDPIVVEVESGGNLYSVVPEVLYCSCPDHRFRNIDACKHLLRVGLDPELGREIREELARRALDGDDGVAGVAIGLSLESITTTVREVRDDSGDGVCADDEEDASGVNALMRDIV